MHNRNNMSEDTGHFSPLLAGQTCVVHSKLKRCGYLGRVNNPMLHCKVVALIVFVFLISMISTLRFAKRVPSFSTKFHKVVQSSTASLSTSTRKVTHPNYDEIDTFSISEYGLKGSLYKHKQSGAEVVSVIAPDDNKVFGITFRTPPKDRYRMNQCNLLLGLVKLSHFAMQCHHFQYRGSAHPGAQRAVR